MKIKQITLQGITSFKDKTIIPFEKVLKDNQLFAITGATGSGKSTILSSIFLALYGRTPKNLNRNEFVTLGQQEGNIEVLFTFKGKDYTALWNCKTHGRDGMLKNPKIDRRLYCEQKAIELNPEELLQLTLDQFAKTIIINQGQFADFLTSSFVERRKILEKIYQIEEIALIPPLLRRKIKEINAEIQSLEDQIESSKIFNEKEFKEIKVEHQQAISEKKYLDQIYNEIKYLSPIFKEIDDLHKQKKKDQIDLEDLEKRVKKAVAHYQQKKSIAQEKKINHERENEILESEAPLIDKLLEVMIQQDTTLNEKQNASKRQESNSKNILFYKKKITKTTNDLDQIKKKKEILYQSLNQLIFEVFNSYPQSTGDILKDNNILQNLQNQYNEYQRNTTLHKEIQNALSDLTNELTKIKLDGDELRKKENALSNELEEKDNALKEFKQAYQNDQALKELNKNLQEEAMIFRELNQTIKGLKESLSDIETKIEQNKIKSKENQTRHHETKKQLTESEKRIKHKQLHKNIQNIRDIALESSKCPVCHNQIDQGHFHDIEKLEPHSIEDESIQSQYDQMLEKDKKILQKKYYLNQNLSELENQLTHRSDELSIELKKQEQILSRVQEHIKSQVLNKENILNIINQEIQQNNKRIELFFELSSNKRHLQESHHDIQNRLLDRRNKYQESFKKIRDQEKRIKSSQLQINKIILQITKTLNLAQEIPFDKYPHIIENFDNYWDRISNLIHSHQELGQKELLNSQTIQSDKEVLSKYEHENEKETQEIKSLDLKIIQNNNYIKEACNEISIEKVSSSQDLKKHLDNRKVNLKQLEIKATKAREELYEAQRHKDNLEYKIEMKRENIEHSFDLISSLINQAREKSHQLNLLLTAPEYTTISDKNELLKPRSREMKGLFSKLEQSSIEKIINDERIELLSIAYHEIFLPFFESLDMTKKQIEKNCIEFDTQIKAHEKKLYSIKEKEVQKKSLREKVISKENLYQVIGQDEFSRFSMKFIEDQLLLWTNHELKNLCEGRYKLIQVEKNKKSGPEFFVIDYWKESKERNIKTLSGGETFLLSLAMALGLAELIKGQTQIETFIIDEGFGTLDEEAIDDALEVLNTISLRGKQIGVISHVKGLTNRIPINIELQKNETGDSLVQLIY